MKWSTGLKNDRIIREDKKQIIRTTKQKLNKITVPNEDWFYHSFGLNLKFKLCFSLDIEIFQSVETEKRGESSRKYKNKHSTLKSRLLIGESHSRDFPSFREASGTGSRQGNP